MTTNSKTTPKDFIFAIIIFAGIVFYTLFNNEEKLEKIRNLFNNKTFLISLIFIVAWCFYWLKINTVNVSRYKKATKQAIIGLIIALFAYLDLTIAPFWFVWLSAFFLNI